MLDNAKRLRAVFSGRPVDQEVKSEAVAAAWRTVSGESSAEEVQALLVRVRTEPAVAEAWRLAREIQAVEIPTQEAAPLGPGVVGGPSLPTARSTVAPLFYAVVR